MTSQANANTSNKKNSSFMTSQENLNPLYNTANAANSDDDFDEFMEGLTVCLRTKFYLRF